ncbi:MAG TPA: enoyl-CoA hydratase/isomerase family protein [Vicinamibacterales bacterium]|nr:enoyl-CoA hydratase/isomerase family protein [Vicinamibacterales bacterium]
MASLSVVAVDLLEEGAMLRLVLNQPKANVLTTAMMQELSSALRAHRDHRRLRLVLLRGAGGNFSYGAAVEEHTRDRVAAMLRTFHALVRDVAEYPVPIAALVEGRCLGGAFELALCCHFVFAAAGARLACPEVTLGVFPPVFAIAGPRRMGGALAERLLLTGGEIDARAAEQCGLATALPPGEDPGEAVMRWYREHLAPLSAYALRQAAAASRRGSDLVVALRDELPAIEQQYLEQVATSRDGNEGIEAFIARRPPRWEDA